MRTFKNLNATGLKTRKGDGYGRIILPVQQVSYGPLSIMSIMLIMSCYTGFFNVRRGWQSLNTGPRFYLWIPHNWQTPLQVEEALGPISIPRSSRWVAWFGEPCWAIRPCISNHVFWWWPFWNSDRHKEWKLCTGSSKYLIKRQLLYNIGKEQGLIIWQHTQNVTSVSHTMYNHGHNVYFVSLFDVHSHSSFLVHNLLADF
jgi:hypothetical protein